MHKTISVVGMFTLVLAMPCLALAQAVAPVSDGGIPIAPIVALIVPVIGLLAGVKQWLPSGTHTVVNAVILTGGALVSKLEAMSQMDPRVSIVGALIALAGVIVSRFKTKDGWEI